MLTNSSQAMKTIMNDTLDHSKMESGQFEICRTPANLQDVIAETITTVTISTSFSKSFPEILFFDAGRIQQVIANLISNGIKFVPTDGSGTLCVNAMAIYYNSEISMRDILWKDDLSIGECKRSSFTAEDVHTERASVKSFNESIFLDDISLSEKQLTLISSSKYMLDVIKGQGGEEEKVQYCTIIISIQDNGQGIKPSEVPLLYNPFQQLEAGLLNSNKGTGLGLAICQAIVSSHGGRVGVRSSGTYIIMNKWLLFFLFCECI